MSASCTHNYESMPLVDVITLCDFTDPAPDKSDLTHSVSEGTYKCGKCGSMACKSYKKEATKTTLDELHKPRVWNIRDINKPEHALYIGMAGQGQSGHWGNPFSLTRPLSAADVAKITERMPYMAELQYVRAGNIPTREESLQLHRDYFMWAIRNGRLDVKELVIETTNGLIPRDVMCFCAPQPCHGDLVLEFSEAYCFYRNERNEDHLHALDSALYIIRGTVT